MLNMRAKAHATRENRKWLGERNIHITAPPLGRKPRETKKQRKETTYKVSLVKGRMATTSIK
jgi:hypothetical protein